MEEKSSSDGLGAAHSLSDTSRLIVQCHYGFPLGLPGKEGADFCSSCREKGQISLCHGYPGGLCGCSHPHCSLSGQSHTCISCATSCSGHYKEVPEWKGTITAAGTREENPYKVCASVTTFPENSFWHILSGLQINLMFFFPCRVSHLLSSACFSSIHIAKPNSVF